MRVTAGTAGIVCARSQGGQAGAGLGLSKGWHRHPGRRGRRDRRGGRVRHRPAPAAPVRRHPLAGARQRRRAAPAGHLLLGRRRPAPRRPEGHARRPGRHEARPRRRRRPQRHARGQARRRRATRWR